MSYSYADVHNMTAYPSKLIANKIIDSTSDQAYYILASLSEDKSDFEDSTLDVRATDGKCCWCKEGRFLTLSAAMSLLSYKTTCLGWLSQQASIHLGQSFRE